MIVLRFPQIEDASNFKSDYSVKLASLSEIQLVQELESTIQDYAFLGLQVKLLWKNGEITKREKTSYDIQLLNLQNQILWIKGEYSRRDRLIERSVYKSEETNKLLIDQRKAESPPSIQANWEETSHNRLKGEKQGVFE